MPELKNNILSVIVMSGDSIILDTRAYSVSSRNEKGRFDILPMHANFISLIKEFVKINVEADEPKQIVLKIGIVRVFENNVQIFIGSEAS